MSSRSRDSGKCVKFRSFNYVEVVSLDLQGFFSDPAAGDKDAGEIETGR